MILTTISLSISRSKMKDLQISEKGLKKKYISDIPLSKLGDINATPGPILVFFPPYREEILQKYLT